MESKWAEVRAISLKREGDVSGKTSDSETVDREKQNAVEQFRQMTDVISDLKNTVNKQAKQLELYKVRH